MPGHVHARTEETHALTTQAHAMGGERRTPVRPHDSVARHRRVVTVPERVSDRPGGEWTSSDHANECVRRHTTGRDAADDRVDRS
jgi:hypothetical protein